jgi:hypothetical protein
MAIVFLQYSYVCTNAPISVCIPEGILSQIFTWISASLRNPMNSQPFEYVQFRLHLSSVLKLGAKLDRSGCTGEIE